MIFAVVSGWGVVEGAWGQAGPTCGGLVPGSVWPIWAFIFFVLF